MTNGGRSGLIAAGLALLADRWRFEPMVHEVLVDHPHRAVLRATDPVGRTVFLKVEEGVRRAQREVTALDLAHAARIPVPDLLHAQLGDTSVLVLGGVAGRPLGSDDPPTPWAETARHLLDVHRIEVGRGLERFDHREDSWVEFMRWWLAHEVALVVERGLLDRSTAEALGQRADEVLAAMPEPRRRLLHGDCQPDHVLLDEAGAVLALIDWGDASTGDPVWDLAVLTADHPDRLPIVLDAYGVAPSTGEIVLAYWIVRHLGSATWLLDHGFDPSAEVLAATSLR